MDNVVAVEVADGSLLAEADYEGPNLLALVDEMSVALKTALQIPAREGIGDLPVRERLTSNSAAWEEYVLGMTSLVVDDDLDASIEHTRHRYSALRALSAQYEQAQQQHAAQVETLRRQVEQLSGQAT